MSLKNYAKDFKEKNRRFPRYLRGGFFCLYFILIDFLFYGCNKGASSVKERMKNRRIIYNTSCYVKIRQPTIIWFMFLPVKFQSKNSIHFFSVCLSLLVVSNRRVEPMPAIPIISENRRTPKKALLKSRPVCNIATVERLLNILIDEPYASHTKRYILCLFMFILIA